MPDTISSVKHNVLLWFRVSRFVLRFDNPNHKRFPRPVNKKMQTIENNFRLYIYIENVAIMPQVIDNIESAIDNVHIDENDTYVLETFPLCSHFV